MWRNRNPSRSAQRGSGNELDLKSGVTFFAVFVPGTLGVVEEHVVINEPFTSLRVGVALTMRCVRKVDIRASGSPLGNVLHGTLRVHMATEHTVEGVP